MRGRRASCAGRLTRAPALSAEPAATGPTGVDVWLGQAVVEQAPAGGEVLAAAPGRSGIAYGAMC